MTKQEFGQWSREKRAEAGLSQQQVKHLTGRNVKDVERGKVGASFNACKDLAEVYDVPPKEWLAIWLGHVLPIDGVDVGPASEALATALGDHVKDHYASFRED